MRAVWWVARNLMGRRRGATLSLALLVGLGGGAVIAAVAGASRTDSAMRRFVAYSRPPDLTITVNGAQGDPSDPAVVARGTAIRERVMHLPEVRDAGRAPYLFLAADAHGRDVGSLNLFASAEDRALRTFDRPRLLHGRLPRADRVDEAVVDDVTAAQRHLHLGSRVRVYAFSASQSISPDVTAFAKYPPPEGPSYRLRIVGITRLATTVDAPPVSATREAFYLGVGAMHLTPAFLRQFAHDQGEALEVIPGMEQIRVRLRHGLRDLPGFERGVARVVDPGDGRIQIGSDTHDASVKAQNAVRLEAIALLLFAGVAGVAALLILGSVLARQVRADAGDHATLTALGMTSRARVAVPLVRASVVAILGAFVAVVVAVLASPLTPIGLARRAEIHPGVSVNTAALALGFVGVVVVTMLCALVPAVRAARQRADASERAVAGSTRLQRLVARAGAGPAAFAAVSMSLERRALAFRAALLAFVVAVAGVTGAATFAVSLRHLVDTPREQGWNWDVLVGNSQSDALAGDPHAVTLHQKMSDILRANRYVGAFAGLAQGDGVTVDGQPVDVGGIDEIEGFVSAPIVAGRAPRAADEIALARDTLGQLHRHVGDVVTVGVAARHVRMRIVGQALVPTAGGLLPKLSSGGIVTIAGLQRVEPDAPALQFAVRYRHGADRRVAFASLTDAFGREVLEPFPGGEIGDLATVDFLPAVLAGVLVVLAAGGLVLMLLGSVRSHRRDLAVLETIGFVRRQVSATVAWQATALALTAIVVGVPCGIALGRLTWRLVAHSVGSVSPAIVPVTGVLLVAPVALVAANVLAGAPAWRAGRTRPNVVLRAE